MKFFYSQDANYSPGDLLFIDYFTLTHKNLFCFLHVDGHPIYKAAEFKTPWVEIKDADFNGYGGYQGKSQGKIALVVGQMKLEKIYLQTFFSSGLRLVEPDWLQREEYFYKVLVEDRLAVLARRFNIRKAFQY